MNELKQKLERVTADKQATYDKYVAIDDEKKDLSTANSRLMKDYDLLFKNYRELEGQLGDETKALRQSQEQFQSAEEMWGKELAVAEEKLLRESQEKLESEERLIKETADFAKKR